MADKGANINAVGCLGRLLTLVGVIWLVIVALAGLGILSESAMSGGFLAGLGSSLIPGLVFLAAGRALSRRAKSVAGEPQPLPLTATPPIVPRREVHSPPTEPAQKAPIPYEPPPPSEPVIMPPLPTVQPVAETREEKSKRLAEAFSRLEDAKDEKSAFRPKNSQEMIDEAKKRWGRGNDHGR